MEEFDVLKEYLQNKGRSERVINYTVQTPKASLRISAVECYGRAYRQNALINTSVSTL